MSFGKFLTAVGKGLKAAAKASPRQQEAARPKGKAFPVLTPDMLTPPDKEFTKAEAVKLYEMFLVQVGYADKDDARLDALEFKDDIDRMEEQLKENVDYAAQEYEDAKASVAEEKADIRAEGYTRAELKDMLAQVSDDDIKAKAALEAAKQRLAAFKQNRRGYLVACINQQIHGTPIPSDYAN